MISCHIPCTFPTSACTPSFPSVPTSLATFFTSAAKIASWSIISLVVLTRLSISPETETPVIFWVRSPRATAVYSRVKTKYAKNKADFTHSCNGNGSNLECQLEILNVRNINRTRKGDTNVICHNVDIIGQIFPSPTNVRYPRLTTESSFRAYFARNSRDFVREDT